MLYVKPSCQARTTDPSLQTESKFPVGDGVHSPLTESPHCYVSGEKGALNQQGAGWVSQVQWIYCPTSEFLHQEATLCRVLDLETGLKTSATVPSVTKPRTFCGIYHYHHLSDLVQTIYFYGLNKTVLLLVEMLFGWIVGDCGFERAAESGTCTGQVGVLCPQAQIRTST